MPVSIRKLAPEESERAFPRRAQQNLSEYVAALRDLAPGEVAEIDLQGLSDRAIKRRLGQAAKGLGYRVKWGRQSSPEGLYFQVAGTGPAKATDGRRRRRGAPPARPEPTPTSTTRGRRQRSTVEASAAQMPAPGPARRGRRRMVAASG